MDKLHDLAERLRSVKHFQHLPIHEVVNIVAAGQVQKIQEGAIIFLEGGTGAGMHVLIKGLVHLCKIGPQGRENIIKVVHPVTMFNEVTVLDGGENPVCARAAQDCLVWLIGYEPFQRLLMRHPEISLGMLKVLATRNRQLIAHYADLSFRPVLARVAKLLLELSENGQRNIQRREHSISQMAARVASVPEAVSRALGELARREIIFSTRTEIRILNAKLLGETAQIEQLVLE